MSTDYYGVNPIQVAEGLGLGESVQAFRRRGGASSRPCDNHAERTHGLTLFSDRVSSAVLKQTAQEDCPGSGVGRIERLKPCFH